jgi:hypothetical protein
MTPNRWLQRNRPVCTLCSLMAWFSEPTRFAGAMVASAYMEADANEG